MKVLFWYCENFAWNPTLKTLPDAPDAAAEDRQNCIVAFIHVEPKDVAGSSSAETKLVKNAKWLARKWNTVQVVLHSFTHLGEQKADPEQAKALLDRAEKRLTAAGYTISQTERKNGGILLFHDIHQYSVDQLEPIILGLKERGYTFTNLDDIAAFPLLNGETPPERPFVGTECATDSECAFSSSLGEGFCFQHGSETTYGFCMAPCEGYCPDMAGYAPTFCTSLARSVAVRLTHASTSFSAW